MSGCVLGCGGERGEVAVCMSEDFISGPACHTPLGSECISSPMRPGGGQSCSGNDGSQALGELPPSPPGSRSLLAGCCQQLSRVFKIVAPTQSHGELACKRCWWPGPGISPCISANSPQSALPSAPTLSLLLARVLGFWLSRVFQEQV